MRRLVQIAAIAAVLLAIGSAPLQAAGPYVNGQFRGRIAYSADGNHNDPDDWAASPVALAIFAEAGLKDRLVHFDYNCILPQTNPDWEKTHADSVLGAAKHYGYDLARFHDCRQDVEAATASIQRAIDDSSAENPLYFIVAGPMQVPLMGIEKSNPAKRPFVYCISHSRWNDGFAPTYQFAKTKRSVIPSGINWVQIADQNRLLSLSPYGRPAPMEAFAPYQWMRDSKHERVRFLWERLLVSTRPDPSDAGMAFFLATGDEQADPQKLRRLLDENIAPSPVAARNNVRLEAENFRELEGYEVEDRNDRTASHRLSVKRSGGSPARISTRYNEPYAPASGQFDVEIRFASEDASEVSGLQLSINGKAQNPAELASGQQPGWQTAVIRNVAISEGDTIALESKTPVRLDYIQLNAKG
jgi:hypothetical protein